MTVRLMLDGEDSFTPIVYDTLEQAYAAVETMSDEMRQFAFVLDEATGADLVVNGQLVQQPKTETQPETQAALPLAETAAPDVVISDPPEPPEPVVAVNESGETTWVGEERLAEWLVPIVDLKPHPANKNKGDVPAIMESLKRFGQVRPVLTNEAGTIVAGHHTTEAARRLGWTHIAAVAAKFASAEDTLAYLVADNQVARRAKMTPTDQLELMEEIAQSGNWEGTGFTEEDWKNMLALKAHQQEEARQADLKRHEQHYKEHPLDQIQELARSLLQHGFYQPIVVAKDGTVLVGHAVLEAARWLGISKVPITRLDIEPDSPAALKILTGDNTVGHMAERDDRKLAELLKEVREADERGLDGTGYSAEALANLLMVTRPAHEIEDKNAALQWVGLPHYDESDTKPIKIVVSVANMEHRDAVLRILGVTVKKGQSGAISLWWPNKPRHDLSSLRFDFGEDGEVTIDDPGKVEQVAEGEAAVVAAGDVQQDEGKP